MTGAVKLNTAGGGSVVVQPASSIASDVTVNVPSVSTTLVGTDTTQTLTNKTLTTPNIDSAQVATVSGTAPLYMCRAWVNFNGTGTVAIRASGNVTSITDGGVGNYTVNFASAMPDANYAAQVTGKTSGANTGVIGSAQNSTQTTTTFGVLTIDSTGSVRDSVQVSVAIFR